MNTIATIVSEASSSFGLKAALEKFGFASEEDLFVSFISQGKEVKSAAITVGSEEKTSTINTDEDLKTTILDWLNQTEQEYQISSAISQELSLLEKGDVDITLKVSSDSKEYAMSGLKYYCPCPSPPPFPPYCCWR